MPSFSVQTSMNVPSTLTSAPMACARTCAGATAASATWATSQIPRARTVWVSSGQLQLPGAGIQELRDAGERVARTQCGAGSQMQASD